MLSRSLLLVLLGLSCLQAFTMAQNADGASLCFDTAVSGASLCCFEFHKKPIPAAIIVTYEETRSDCTLPGVIFKTIKGRRICADPEVEWVKQVIKIKPSALTRTTE